MYNIATELPHQEERLHNEYILQIYGNRMNDSNIFVHTISLEFVNIDMTCFCRLWYNHWLNHCRVSPKSLLAIVSNVSCLLDRCEEEMFVWENTTQLHPLPLVQLLDAHVVYMEMTYGILLLMYQHHASFTQQYFDHHEINWLDIWLNIVAIWLQIL